MTTKSSKTVKTPTQKRAKNDFRRLWDILPHPPLSVVRVFARGKDSRDGDYARSYRDIERFAAAHGEKNIYVAPNPTSHTGGVRHSAKHVSHWSFFVIDVDPVKKKFDIKRARNHVMHAFSNMMRDRGFEIYGRPIIIDSGRGSQVWYRLDDVHLYENICGLTLDAIQPDGDNWVTTRKTARRTNGWWLSELDERVGLTNGCRIDTSVSDLPRVMRCPGTINQKTGKKTKFTLWTKRRFPGLAVAMVMAVPPGYFLDPEPSEELAPGVSWQEAYPHLTRTAQNYLLTGQAEPGRHRVMWHTAKKLREVGVSRKEAARALKWANKLKGKDEALPLDQVKHALDTAYLD